MGLFKFIAVSRLCRTPSPKPELTLREKFGFNGQAHYRSRCKAIRDNCFISSLSKMQHLASELLSGDEAVFDSLRKGGVPASLGERTQQRIVLMNQWFSSHRLSKSDLDLSCTLSPPSGLCFAATVRFIQNQGQFFDWRDSQVEISEMQNRLLKAFGKTSACSLLSLNSVLFQYKLELTKETPCYPINPDLTDFVKGFASIMKYLGNDKPRICGCSFQYRPNMVHVFGLVYSQSLKAIYDNEYSDLIRATSFEDFGFKLAMYSIDLERRMMQASGTDDHCISFIKFWWLSSTSVS